MKFNPRYVLPVILAVAGLGVSVYCSAALASAANSIQPGRTFFHTVHSGNHPNKLVVLHNGTGAPRRIATISIAGSGGYVFTLPVNTPALASSGLPTCKVGMVLPAGGKCARDIRVHTVRVGWWRSVLRIAYRNGWNNSGQVEAHVVS